MHLHRFAPGTNGRDGLHTRLAWLLPAAQNLATCSGRRITELFNSQGTAKPAGTSISQGPTSNSLEQNVSEMSQGQQTGFCLLLSKLKLVTKSLVVLK